MPAVDCIVRRDRGGFSRAHRAQFFVPRLVYRYRRSPLWQQYRCSFIAGVAADRGAAGGGRRARSLRDCGWLGGTRRERRDRGRQARRASSPGGSPKPPHCARCSRRASRRHWRRGKRSVMTRAGPRDVCGLAGPDIAGARRSTT